MDEWLLISCTRHDQECERRMMMYVWRRMMEKWMPTFASCFSKQINKFSQSLVQRHERKLNWRNVNATYSLKKTANSMSFLEKQKSCSKLYVKIIFLWKAFTKKWFKNDIVFFWNNEKMECSENVFLWNALPLTSWWKVDLWKHYYSATISFWNHLTMKWTQQAMMTMWYASN